MSKKIHIKTSDTVLILSGADRGKKGKVLAISPKEGKVIVEGRNIIKRHVKPRKMGDAGGIIDAPSAIYACKVQVVCPSCHKPTRVAHSFDDKGVKSRSCKRCNKNL